MHTVNSALEEFKKLIRGKNFLFIELTPMALSVIPEFKPKVKITNAWVREHAFKGDIGAYQILARAALKAGLTVVPLDAEKNAMVNLAYTRRDRNYTIERAYEIEAYQNLEKREKDWAAKLKNFKSDAVVVAVAAHLRGLQSRLGIPESNCIMRDENIGNNPRMRKMARIELQRIESERMARQLRKSRERARQNSKKKRSKT